MRTLFLVALLHFIVGIAPGRQVQPGTFHIAVVDGDGALNNVETRIARQLVIRVEDSAGKPVPGAQVSFEGPMPEMGAGDLFANGSTHFLAITDVSGLAVATGIRNNGIAGAFTIAIHVSYQGQSVAETSIHQANVSRQVAEMSNKLQAGKEAAGQLALSASVLGVASGDQFMVNGAPTPGNANLLNSTRVQTLSSPTTLFLHSNCEFLEGPHSSVLIAPSAVTLENGTIRASHFGNCKLGYGGLWVVAKDAPAAADGVLSISNDAMQVASVSGELQIVNALGDVIGTVAPGTVSSFPIAASASGATIGGSPQMSTRTKALIGAGTAAALTGLGVGLAEAASSTSP